MDGNIFAILGKAARLLREDGQPDQAAEMTRQCPLPAKIDRKKVKKTE